MVTYEHAAHGNKVAQIHQQGFSSVELFCSGAAVMLTLRGKKGGRSQTVVMDIDDLRKALLELEIVKKRE